MTLKVKTLFISPEFFSIDEAIEDRLAFLGHQVTRIKDRPTNNVIAKFLLTKAPLLMPYFFDTYYERKLKELQTDFDYVLVINGQCLSPNIVSKLRNKLSRATFIFYTWDSIKNRQNSIKIAKLFDKKFCFDRESISYAREKYKLRFDFRPLFYVNETDPGAAGFTEEKNAGALFLGTMHSDRHKVLVRLSKVLKTSGITFTKYLFVQSKIVFFVKKYITRELSSGVVSDFIFQPVSKSIADEEFSKCEYVIDIEHANQSGLTIRTFEVIKNDKKLITTNSDIVNYDFYDPKFIAVIDRKSPRLDSLFLTPSLVRYDQYIKHKYSLDGWIIDVFGDIG